MSHPHLCPVCRQAFNCRGTKCRDFNGVPHKRCAPTNRFAKMTDEIVTPTPRFNEGERVVLAEFEGEPEERGIVLALENKHQLLYAVQVDEKYRTSPLDDGIRGGVGEDQMLHEREVRQSLLENGFYWYRKQDETEWQIVKIETTMFDPEFQDNVIWYFGSEIEGEFNTVNGELIGPLVNPDSQSQNNEIHVFVQHGKTVDEQARTSRW